jgi:hypothetical protein
MKTECISNRVVAQGTGGRNFEADFGGGRITSDGGALLLMETDRRIRLIDRLAACFADLRDPEKIEHSARAMVAQRVFALALGYEDLNDHDDLSRDTLLASLCGLADPTGASRKRERDRECERALAGKSTLHRLETTPADAARGARYKKVVYDASLIESLFIDIFLESFASPPEEIILDFDATDDPIHGGQEGRFFHGYYNEYCYLPLYVFCGGHLLFARLRPSDIDGAAGSVEALSMIVSRVRERWPRTRIVMRGDSGFCREEIMAWCEREGVCYIFGIAQNARLNAIIREELAEAGRIHKETGSPARVFKDFTYSTLNSWSRERRVVAKAEHLEKGANPRFVVSNISQERFDARTLYEDIYCARGEMENRIKEQQMCLFADRTSSHTMRANQLRLYLSSAGYILMEALRRLGLQGTEMRDARCDTIRLKLLKIGAQIKVSVRRIWVRFTSAYPLKPLFFRVCNNLQLTPLLC